MGDGVTSIIQCQLVATSRAVLAVGGGSLGVRAVALADTTDDPLAGVPGLEHAPHGREVAAVAVRGLGLDNRLLGALPPPHGCLGEPTVKDGIFFEGDGRL